jgi:hypothetical protein
LEAEEEEITQVAQVLVVDLEVVVLVMVQLLLVVGE